VWGPTRSDRRRRHTRTQRVPVVGGVGALVTRWVTRWVPGVDVGHPVAAVAAVAAVAKVQGRQGAVAVVVTAAVAVVVVVVVVGCCSCQCRHHPSLGCLGQHQRRHGGGGHKLGEEARIQPVKGGNIAGSSQVTNSSVKDARCGSMHAGICSSAWRHLEGTMMTRRVAFATRADGAPTQIFMRRWWLVPWESLSIT
jgi:hypothetical protein